MKKHKRKALRKAFTAVFSLTLIALALVAYGLLCWRAGQYKILEGRWQSTHGGEIKTAYGAGESPAPSTPLPQRPEKVEGQDFSSSTEGRAPKADKVIPQYLTPDAVPENGQAKDHGRAGDIPANTCHSRNQARPTEFTSKPKAKHPTRASGARSNPMPGYPEKWADPKQSVWLYRDQDRGMK